MDSILDRDTVHKYFATAPVTVAIALGPLLDIVQHVDGAVGNGASNVSQIVRGSLTVLMLVSLRAWSKILRPLPALVLPLVGLSVYALVLSMVRGSSYEGVVFSIRLCFVAAVYASVTVAARQGTIDERWLVCVAWIV